MVGSDCLIESLLGLYCYRFKVHLLSCFCEGKKEHFVESHGLKSVAPFLPHAVLLLKTSRWGNLLSIHPRIKIRGTLLIG